MKGLLRLYPRSWRKRYGPEMEVLVDDMGGRVGVALDLVIGAAVAYRDVIARNRILAAAGACLHGMCVTVLIQAIAFVTLILVARQNAGATDIRIGPLDFVSVFKTEFFYLGESQFGRAGLLSEMNIGWLPGSALLVVLVLALGLLLASPRLLRRLG